MDTLGDDIVSLIKAAKDAGYVVPSELAKIADGLERIVSQLPQNSVGSLLGWSYIMTLGEGGFGHPEIEQMARFMVFNAINEEENNRFLRSSK